MKTLQPIETVYKGYRFRSRLEARWGKFLDGLGVRWEYEPEGFELTNGMRYLPDFYLPDDRVWIEIKPMKGPTHAELSKVLAFTEQVDVVILGIGTLDIYGEDGRIAVLIRHPRSGFCLCQAWLGLEPASQRLAILIFPEQNTDGKWTAYTPSLNKVERIESATSYMPAPVVLAYEAAKQARFEHEDNR